MSSRKLAQVAFGIALAALFLWLVLRQISLDELQLAFASARPGLILAAVAMFCVGYGCRIERWRLMLVHDNPALRWPDVAGPFVGCVAANNVLPLRAGDLLRAFGFNRRLGTSTAAALASVLVERLLDLLMVAAILGGALAWFGTSSSRLLGVGAAVLIGAAALILLLLLFPAMFRPAALGAVRLLSLLSPGAGDRVRIQVDKLFGALGQMAHGATMLALAGWSALAWLAEGTVFWLCALALPSISQPLGAWLALPVGTLATVIPSTPGFVGTFDYFVMQAAAAAGNTIPAAAAYALLVHTVLWLPPTLAGGLYLLAKPAQRLGRPDHAFD